MHWRDVTAICLHSGEYDCIRGMRKDEVAVSLIWLFACTAPLASLCADRLAAHEIRSVGGGAGLDLRLPQMEVFPLRAFVTFPHIRKATFGRGRTKAQCEAFRRRFGPYRTKAEEDFKGFI
jgi:hypothetical protein